MLLKSIKLINFRQFRETFVEFSCDNNSNVTIILGDNGSGKTTFSQAFLWCLYGETSFTDKVLINKHVAHDLTLSSSATVKVELCFTHGDVDYKVVRTQEYKIDKLGQIKEGKHSFDVSRKGLDGNVFWVGNEIEKERTIKTIMPQELSRYFFFDGERIEKMGRTINNGEKSEEFASAVKGCLGLFGMEKAIKHLSASRNGVIKSFENEYQTAGNSKMEELVQEINSLGEKQDEINNAIQNTENEIEKASNIKIQKKAELKKYEDSKSLQEKIEKLENEISVDENSLDVQRKDFLDHFKMQMQGFFSLSLINSALNFMDKRDIVGNTIPSINDQTLNYLLKRGECICGTCLKDGSEPYSKIQDLLKYVPPQSIGTTLSNFKKEAARLIENPLSLERDVKLNFNQISHLRDDIESKKAEIQNYQDKLNGENVQSKVREISRVIESCDAVLRNEKEKNKTLLQQLGALVAQKERAEKDRSNLALQDRNNQMIETYLAYAKRILEDLKQEYNEKEAEIRTRLEDKINVIFRSIYNGGLRLAIDEKYHISVYSERYNDDVETSTAQSISVIFAFITGIIQIAKDEELLHEQLYPLVMDAPLSSFDKTRIESVCRIIPSIAEQVVLFIKNTDGDIAEQYLRDRIGKKYSFVKKDELSTCIE